MVSDCRSLARFELRGIPSMVAGAARILVTFRVDADGLLSVAAEEQSQGVAASVTVKPSYGLTDNEIADMLQSSIEYAAEDMSARKLAEERVEASRVIEALRAALDADGETLMNPQERARVEILLVSLTETAAGNDVAAINAAVKALEAGCEFYVERRMNASIHKAMAGRAVKDFE
jgi:molecular chaperone HscA